MKFTIGSLACLFVLLGRQPLSTDDHDRLQYQKVGEVPSGFPLRLLAEANRRWVVMKDPVRRIRQRPRTGLTPIGLIIVFRSASMMA